MSKNAFLSHSNIIWKILTKNGFKFEKFQYYGVH